MTMNGTRSNRRYWRHRDKDDRQEEMKRFFKDEVNMIATDSNVLVEAMLENINDVYAQVLAGVSVDDDDVSERLFYVNGVIAGMTNLLVSCGVFDKETGKNITEFFEGYIRDNRG